MALYILSKKSLGSGCIVAEGRYRAIRAESSIEVSRECVGNRYEGMMRVLTHPHARKAMGALGWDWLGYLSIVY